MDASVDKSECPLVLIEWEDSARPIPEWRYLSDFKASGPVKCASVGWLLYDGTDKKVLAPNMGEIESEHNIQACGVIMIPARAVTRVVRVKEID